MSKKTQSVCPRCNNTFNHYPHINRVFCSRSCRSQHTQPNKKTTCQHCNSVFTHHASLNPKFCSRACVTKSRIKTKKKSTCQHCNSVFTHHASLNPKFCSRACVTKSRSKHKGSEVPMHECQNCKSTFKEKPNCANKYCSQNCYLNARWGETRPWSDCSSCLASIGFGAKITEKLLGVDCKSIIHQRKRDGIKTNTPPMGSWYIWAKRKQAGKNPDRKRTPEEVIYEKARMEDIKQACKRGFDWRYEWTKEVAKRRYNAMTPEEKAEKQKMQTEQKRAKLEANPDLKKEKARKHREWRSANKEKVRQTQREWVKNNPEKMKAYRKKRMQNPAFRALDNQRKRFKDIMKSVKNGGTSSYSSKIGCTTKEFYAYMESKFKPGMTWGNYGTYWHADHIIPCAAFDQTDPKQVAICWHHSNMQPLEAKENLLKSDKFNEEQLHLLINHTNQDV